MAKGKCWICEDIAGIEAMHLVRRIELTSDGLCHRHTRQKVEQDQRDQEKAKEKVNVDNDQ